jgi:hypothetical protein
MRRQTPSIDGTVTPPTLTFVMVVAAGTKTSAKRIPRAIM